MNRAAICTSTGFAMGSRAQLIALCLNGTCGLNVPAPAALGAKLARVVCCGTGLSVVWAALLSKIAGIVTAMLALWTAQSPSGATGVHAPRRVVVVLNRASGMSVSPR